MVKIYTVFSYVKKKAEKLQNDGSKILQILILGCYIVCNKFFEVDRD